MQKWGIPYIDLWQCCPINPALSVYYNPDLTPDENEEKGYAYRDGQHLSSVGYNILGDIIIRWIETI